MKRHPDREDDDEHDRRVNMMRDPRRWRQIRRRPRCRRQHHEPDDPLPGAAFQRHRCEIVAMPEDDTISRQQDDLTEPSQKKEMLKRKERRGPDHPAEKGEGEHDQSESQGPGPRQGSLHGPDPGKSDPCPEHEGGEADQVTPPGGKVGLDHKRKKDQCRRGPDDEPPVSRPFPTRAPPPGSGKIGQKEWSQPR